MLQSFFDEVLKPAITQAVTKAVKETIIQQNHEQILAWNKLALSQEGRSVLGTKAKLSGSNLFTRLNY